MDEAQKSKRELKDVVGVFLSKSHFQVSSFSEPSVQNPESLETQVASVLAPFSDEETFALNLVFPTYLTPYFKNCYLATNPPEPCDLAIAGRFFDVLSEEASKKELANNYFWIHWPDRRFFDEISRGAFEDGSRERESLANSLVVVDLVRSNISGFENTIRILDQIILVVRPRIEELKNAYKVVKTCYYINRGLETSIFFNAQMTLSEVEKVFAKFSGLVSEFLALPIRCLGAAPINLDSGKFQARARIRLNLDTMAIARSGRVRRETPSLERLRFLQKLKTLTE